MQTHKFGNATGQHTRKLIVSFIRQYQCKHGRPPSRREIADAVGLNSTGGLNYQIGELVKTGQLNRDAGKVRALSLPQKDRVSDQEWIHSQALHWLGEHYVLRYFWNTTTKAFDGFEVLGEGGIQATVMLSDREVS